MNSTTAKSTKYFMYTNNFTYYGWFRPLHAILNKIYYIM